MENAMTNKNREIEVIDGGKRNPNIIPRAKVSEAQLGERLVTTINKETDLQQEAILLWKGYLTSANLMSMIDINSWGYLINLLPLIGDDEIGQIYDGPMTPEEEEEERRQEEIYAKQGMLITTTKTREESLTQEIKAHLQIGGHDNYKVACLWKGYLAALYEWNLLQTDELKRLLALIPQGAEDELMPKLFYLGD